MQSTRRKLRLTVLLCGALAAARLGTAAGAEPAPAKAGHSAILPQGIVLRPRDGDTRFVLEPGGPFAALIFRDDTHVDHIGVVYVAAMRADRDSAWTADDRFWQDPLWSSDVNALVWSPDRSALYVSTGDRGTGAVFRLDLRARRSRRLWPNSETSTAEQGEGRSCEIMTVDPVRRLLRVRYEAAVTREPIAVEVRME